MSLVLDDVLIARNPATGVEIGRVRMTPPDDVAAIVASARATQKLWAGKRWEERKAVLSRWWKILIRDVEIWSDLIRNEIGKPRIEALAGEVVPTLDGIRWTIKHGGSVLRGERVRPGWQRLILMPTAHVRWCPVGVVAMIGTWNYPLFLNGPPIAQALAAGNAVVWKPSELAVHSGQTLQQSFEEAGVPEGLVTAVFGGPDVGAALVESDIDKGFFTGGIDSGRRVLAALGARGVSAVAELSGFDPAVILPDAPLESTVRALTWGAFVGCGQTCVSVKRAYVVGDPRPWAEAFALRARSLKVGNPTRAEVDIGPMITESARLRFDGLIKASVRAGARVLAGGEGIPGLGWYYAPTVLLAEDAEAEAALAGAFGPVLLVRSVADAEAAVAAANSGQFALGASVWGRNRKVARAVASQIEAGTVCINEAVTPTAHAGAPFGGRKASGYGRTHGVIGLREFTQPQAVFERRPGGFRPQLFPYAGGATVERFLSVYRRLCHPRN
jgi:acyl-CoA reductase-like NAD-dependent aldehyde dehydrogenase